MRSTKFQAESAMDKRVFGNAFRVLAYEASPNHKQGLLPVAYYLLPNSTVHFFDKAEERRLAFFRALEYSGMFQDFRKHDSDFLLQN